MRVGAQHHAPAAVPPGNTRYSFYRKLGGPQGRSGRVRKFSLPLGFDPRNVQPVASRYTNWAIPATTHMGKSPWKSNCHSTIHKILRWLWHSYIEDSHLLVCYDKNSSKTALPWSGMLHNYSKRSQLIYQLTWCDNASSSVPQVTSYYFWQTKGSFWKPHDIWMPWKWNASR